MAQLFRLVVGQGTKPAYLRELLEWVRALIPRREVLEGAGAESNAEAVRTEIHGSLVEVGVADLLQIAEMIRKTGIIRLRDENGRTGSIWVRIGQVVDAEGRLNASAPDEITASGDEAIYALLGWLAGSFE